MNIITSTHNVHVPSGIYANVPLAPLNWFQTGGHARYLSQPTTLQEFCIALQFAREHELPVFLLGEGANILVSDDGFDGLVIRPQLKEITADDIDAQQVLVTAQAGVTMNDLITWCLERNVIGLEEFSGIPSTVGGAVYINLHYFEFLLEHFLVHAQIVNKSSGIIVTVDKNWFNFVYNYSKLHDGNHYLIDATFKLKKVDLIKNAYAHGRREETMRHRAKRYPSAGTCGSFFRNFYDHEVSIIDHGRKMIFVAYYLDKLGVKGSLRHGNAMVSYQHANMIVNTGGATSSDIISVARTMQEMVKQEFGITPHPECRLIGFKESPLL